MNQSNKQREKVINQLELFIYGTLFVGVCFFSIIGTILIQLKPNWHQAVLYCFYQKKEDVMKNIKRVKYLKYYVVSMSAYTVSSYLILTQFTA